MTVETPDANCAQAEYWNAAAGETWAALSDRLDRMIGPVGLAAMNALPPPPARRSWISAAAAARRPSN